MADSVKRDEKDLLTTARKRLGLTQQQVADKAGINSRHYQMFEGGTRKLSSASFSTTTRVLEALELDSTTLPSITVVTFTIL